MNSVTDGMPEIEQAVATANADAQVAEYTRTEAELADLRLRFEGVVFDVSTKKGLEDAKKGRRELSKLLSDLETMRTELKAPLLVRGRLVDNEAKRIAAEIEKLKTPIDTIIKAEEARLEVERLERERAEQLRISAIQAAIAEIRNLPAEAIGKSAVEILAMAEKADTMPIDAAFFGGYANEATVARNAVAAKLRQAHAAQVAADAAAEAEQARLAAERAEIERLRAEQVAREEQARIEREKQEEIARQEREKQEAAAKLERERLEAIALQERKKHEAEMRAQREALERQQAEAAAREEQARIERVKQAAAATLERERQEDEMRKQREALELQQAEVARERAELAKQHEQQVVVVRPAAAPVPAAAVSEAVPSAAPESQPSPRLTEARQVLVQFRDQYSDLPELAGVIREINAFVAE